MKILRHIVLVVIGVLWCGCAAAQYYSWGTDRPQKWSRIETPQFSLIYPDSAHALARRTQLYVDCVQRDIGRGFRHGPMPRMPFVMHGGNFESNGLVMYMPRRVEFLTIPSEDNYSTLWLKQLVAHEYRHTVQYNNLNRGVFRALSYLTGQHAPTVSLLCMPAWAMEGDAVMTETAMSTYGRGLQPSFTMAYRALAERIGRDHRGRERKNVDRWFCGSYRDYIPDHYALGYQICTYAYTRFGENIWDRVADYGARRPYVVATIHKSLKKYYNTSVRQLFHDTFDDLRNHWAGMPAVVDRAQRIVGMDPKDYTTYKFPQRMADGRILVIKSDLDDVPRFVAVDRAGGERILARIGVVSSRPQIAGDRVWWTELRRSTLFEESVHSVLCTMSLNDARPKTIGRFHNVRYATPAEELMGWIAYRSDGVYELVVSDLETLEERERRAFPAGSEVHGLAWDGRSRAWYALLTDDDGMSIVRVDRAGLHRVTRPAYITLSDLRAQDGQLYFGSIASGRDEVHRYDLATGREYRISTSDYGSFDPAPDGEGVLMTAYDARGYALAWHDREHEVEVEPRFTPCDVVNPVRRRWPAVNLDRVRFTARDSLREEHATPAKKYRKGLNLFSLHGWLPVGFDPFQAVDNHEVDLNFGVTLLSQNLLSSAEAFASYGWNQQQGSLWKVGMRYYGLGLAWEGRYTYGGDQIVSRLVTRNPDPTIQEPVEQPVPQISHYQSVDLAVSLPLLFQRGAWMHQFSVSAGWNYANSLVADLDAAQWAHGVKPGDYRITNIADIGYNKGIHKLSVGMGYAAQQRMAYRDLRPRWGVLAKAAYAMSPSNRDFSDLVSAYAQVYVPGVAAHHSLQVAGAFQTAVGGFRYPWGGRPLTFLSSWLIPRGYAAGAITADHYRAASVDYELPLWHPEGGIPSVLYIKRIRLNVGADVARFGRVTPYGRLMRNLWSVGGDLIFDFNVLRQPPSAMATFRLSVYKPKDGSVWLSGSLGLPF